MRKPYNDILTRLKPFIENRLFILPIGILLLGSLYRFWIQGLYECFVFPNVDYVLFYKWINHNVPAPVWGTVMPPFQPLPYSPFWGIILTPYRYFPYELSKHLWYLSNLLIFFWFIYIAIRWLKESRVLREYKLLEIAIPLILFLNFVPVVKTLRAGQANILVLWFATLSILYFLKGKKVLTGSFLAMAILTKITPVFLILYWVIKKEYRVVISTLVSIGILWVLSIPFTGIQLQLDYIHWLVTYPFVFFGNAQVLDNNMAIFALIKDITNTTGSHSIYPLIYYAIFIAITLGIWYRCIHSNTDNKKQSIILEYGWSFALVPFITQYTEDHHFVYLLVLYAGILLYLREKFPIWIWVLFFLSWLLINCTFFIYDMKLVPIYDVYGYRYIYTYGVILAEIVGGTILYYMNKRDVG